MSFLAKVKELLNVTDKDENFSETEEIKMVEVKTKDGDILRVKSENIAPTAEVVGIDESGETKVDNGEYILEDESTITIEDGKISNVKVEETETEEVKEEAKVEEEAFNELELPTEEAPTVENKEETKEDESKEDESKEDSKVNEVIELLANKLDELSAKINSMDEDFSKFKKSPSTQSITEVKADNKWDNDIYKNIGRFRQKN